MPKDKSQLDIYQIERETVVAEMYKSLAPDQQAQLTTLFDTVTVGTPTPEDITALSESIVEYIIRQQNNNPSINWFNGCTIYYRNSREKSKGRFAAIIKTIPFNSTPTFKDGTKNPECKEPVYITQFVRSANVNKPTMQKKLSNRRFSQLIHLLYAYDIIVTSSNSRQQRYDFFLTFPTFPLTIS